jgi:hypothetical protein
METEQNGWLASAACCGWAAWLSLFLIAGDACDGIERLGNSNGKHSALACIERLTPLPIPLGKIRNRTGVPLKGSDAPLNGRLGKWQVLNLSLPIAVGYAGNRDVNDSAKLATALDAKNCEPGIGLVCRWRECPDLTGAKLGRRWGGLLGATAKKESEQTHGNEKCFWHAKWGAAAQRLDQQTNRLLIQSQKFCLTLFINLSLPRLLAKHTTATSQIAIEISLSFLCTSNTTMHIR